MMPQLHDDLAAMVGVWVDELRAFHPDGSEMTVDTVGGAPGVMPTSNLVYVDFDGAVYRQTNVSLDRAQLARSFTATVAEGVLTFDRLGPEAPVHRGYSGGPGVIWFVAEDIRSGGLAHYCEPDVITLDGDTRHRRTVLWREGVVARLLDVTGRRMTAETGRRVDIDPRGSGPVHEIRSQTMHYLGNEDT